MLNESHAPAPAERRTRRGVSPFRGPRERIAAGLRLATYLGCVWAVGMLFAARAVRADLDETLIGVGHETMRLADARAQSEPTELRLNGASVFVSSGMHDGSVTDVLDAFAARCRALDGQWDAQLSDAGETELARSGVLSGTLREGDETRGYVACLDMGSDTVEPTELLARVGAFLDDGDLSHVGHLRYAFAEEAAHGAHFVTVHTEGSLGVFDMFPASGDAPGVDPDGVPRPDGARRVLSVAPAGEPYGLTVFGDLRGSVDGVTSFYRRELEAAGFVLRQGEDGSAYVDGDARGIVAERDGRLLVVAVFPDPEGGTTVEIAETLDLPEAM